MHACRLASLSPSLSLWGRFATIQGDHLSVKTRALPRCRPIIHGLKPLQLGHALKGFPPPSCDDKCVGAAGTPMAAILMPLTTRHGIPADPVAHLHQPPLTFDGNNPAVAEREWQHLLILAECWRSSSHALDQNMLQPVQPLRFQRHEARQSVAHCLGCPDDLVHGEDAISGDAQHARGIVLLQLH